MTKTELIAMMAATIAAGNAAGNNPRTTQKMVREAIAIYDEVAAQLGKTTMAQIGRPNNDVEGSF